jgi:hypothetical protein
MIDYKEINGLGLAASLAKVGSGMGSCFRFLPRRLQHLRKYIFNRLRRNL